MNIGSCELGQSVRYSFKPGDYVGLFLEGSKDTWQLAVNHRFVAELFNDTLDEQVFAAYLIQDYQFFDVFLSTLGACVAYGDRLESKLRFSKQLARCSGS
ncbi:hypothetical protein CSDY_1885 [Streptococcus dysgalactiae]